VVRGDAQMTFILLYIYVPEPSANSPLHAICIRSCLLLCRECSLILLAVEILPEVLGRR
jgi:hypothetical protein